MEKLKEHAIKSAIKLINNPLTKPNLYPEINKQNVPGIMGIIMLMILKSIIAGNTHLLETALETALITSLVRFSTTLIYTYLYKI